MIWHGKGFWASLGDLPPLMPRWPETRVSIGKFKVTTFIQRDRADVKHSIVG